MRKPELESVTMPPKRSFLIAVREILLVLTGRKDNRIEPPVLRELAFSATPTKAECEALYAYVNDVRGKLASLLERLDG